MERLLNSNWRSFLCIFAFLCIFQSILSQSLIQDAELKIFAAELEPYTNAKSEVVFVLDESGSIGADVFPHEVAFTELLARLLTVSSTNTRVAIITYSTGFITRLDYIRSSGSNNMCTLLQDLAKIDYKGGWTHTRSALVAAGNILQSARPGANRIIILISDGQSTSSDGNPVTVAQQLKGQGVILFSVGVASINKDELLAIASSPRHIYMLKDFKKIKEINEQLVKDTKEVNWDLVSSSSCNHLCSEGTDCCDVQADCMCGATGGRVECACKPGYSGGGEKGKCEICPIGTYKPIAGPLDCTECPGNSTTKDRGSTDASSCFCMKGYVGNPGKGVPCKPVECAKLSKPDGGSLNPPNCGNTFNSTCSFYCHEGHCPYHCNKILQSNAKIEPWRIKPQQPRQCLETGVWSGEDFQCEKIRCPPLNFPENGNHNCSVSDFTFGTICQMICNEGFERQGSQIRECLINGTWTGVTTHCKEITCPPLKTNKLLQLKPPTCAKYGGKFRSVCQYFCAKGYDLTSSLPDKAEQGVRKCLHNRHWSNEHENINCKDVTPPNIQCPGSVTVPNDPFKATARVYWGFAVASDNQFANPPRIIHPPGVLKPPHYFILGSTKLTYQTTDAVGLTATCSFTITVVDNEPPRITYCPHDIEKSHHKSVGIPITWKEPQFKDNSGTIAGIVSNKKSGDLFAWGRATLVNYTATDPSGNIAVCSFKVSVKQYDCPHQAPPTNGAVACDVWLQGRTCTAFCNDGYDFVEEVAPVYYCFQGQGNPRWGVPPRTRKKYKFPWPDCGKITKSKGRPVGLQFQYSVSSCPTSAAARRDIAEKFIKLIKHQFRGQKFCSEKQGCNANNVKIRCGNDTSVTSGRTKRQATVQDKPLVPLLDISLSFELPMEEPCQNCTVGTESTGSEKTTNELQIIKSTKAELEANLTKLLQEAHPELQASVQITAVNVSSGCDRGEIYRRGNCIACPIGTYHDEEENKCIRCDIGFYQDAEASNTCKQCPPGHRTEAPGAQGLWECKAPCQPGTYSSTGLESCIACPIGTYQDLPEQKRCNNCPDSKTTWTEGAGSLTECTVPCPVGTYSNTGHEPCALCPRGSYQPNEEQMECIGCPKGLTTYVEGAHALQFCKAIDLCDEFNTCENGGKCRQIGDQVSCECPSGFVGDFCEQNLDDCTSDLCLNNGTCVDGVNNYSCICIPGFSGPNCEEDMNECALDPCLNGGTCIDGVGGFVCKCPDGLGGKFCELNFPDCTSNPCQNGGTCFDMVSGYRCCCLKGFTGKNCESTFNPCESSPCLNNGTCSGFGESFTCSCEPGYAGDKCQNNIDDCASQPCQHGATCVDDINSFACICPSSFIGKLCDTALPSDYILEFQKPLTSDYVKIFNRHHLHAVTVSLWMRTNYKDNRGTPFSYSYKEPKTNKEVDNGFTVMDVNKLIFFLHGKAFHTGIVANMDNNWHHLLATWDSINGNWAVYWDGTKKQNGTQLGIGQHLWAGYFVLGQEQDTVGGAFSAFEAFTGGIAEFNVWNFSVTDEEVRSINKGCGLIGNVIGWPDVSQHVFGNLAPDRQQKPCSVLGKSECTEDDCYCIKNVVKDDYRTCWHKVDQCSECQNNQPCENKYGKVVCKCSSGFSGSRCQYDVNECLEMNGNCSHLCQNVLGSYMCMCPKGMRLLDDQHTCVDTAYCTVNGLVYLDGESWLNVCEKCICKSGVIVCKAIQCPDLTCGQDEIEHHAPGECCPECIKDPKKCTMNTQGSFVTFDGFRFNFKGICRYVLADDCLNGKFSIHFESSGNSTSISMYVHCVHVALDFTTGITVDSQAVNLPYHIPGLLLIEEKENRSFFITTSMDISLSYDIYGNVQVFSSTGNKNHICGFCGNYNGNISDDLTTRYHLPAKTVEEFGHSWKVESHRYCKKREIGGLRQHHRPLYHDICDGAPYEVQKYAVNVCAALKRKPFKLCHKEVNLSYYYEMCLFDACSCKRKDLCYCDAFAGYALECRKKKIHLKQWATKNKCQMRCPGNLIFDDCGPSCTEVCVAGKVVSNKCHPNEVCVPGCYCAAGMVLHNNTCIFEKDCK